MVVRPHVRALVAVEDDHLQGKLVVGDVSLRLHFALGAGHFVPLREMSALRLGREEGREAPVVAEVSRDEHPDQATCVVPKDLDLLRADHDERFLLDRVGRIAAPRGFDGFVRQATF
jgi:hypothetical protein